jgi:ABC-2 type transport system ATP-binding protein
LAARGTTVIFSTHRMEQVEEICSHIVLMNEGKKILDGAVEKIKEDFKKNEFSIVLSETMPPAEADNPVFLVEHMNGNRLVIKVKEGRSNNEVLLYLIGKGYTVRSFHEILPSINQVFIEQVKKNSVPGTYQPAVA